MSAIILWLLSFYKEDTSVFPLSSHFFTVQNVRHGVNLARDHKGRGVAEG